MKKLLVLGLVGMLLAPMIGLLGIGVVMNPALTNQALCLTGGLTVGVIPDELEVTTRDGVTFTLNKQQLTHAATIITTGVGSRASPATVC